MNIDAFLGQIKKTLPPAPEAAVARFESRIGISLPDDYRGFLVRCNGGYVGGALLFTALTADGERAEAVVHHIGGFREERHFSLDWKLECFEDRIPSDLVWIMDDPAGNAICIGIHGSYRGRVYFWDHEEEPDPDEWDGEVDSAGNVKLLADSFTDFVAGLVASY